MSGSSTLFRRMLDLAGPAVGAPASPRIGRGERIAAMGDSITQNGGYLRAMDAVFAAHYGELGLEPIINAGISGEKAEDMASRFDRDIVARRPDVVTISVGINDVWHRLDAPHDEEVLAEHARNVERMIEAARGAGARVFLLAPTVIEEDAGSEGNRRLARYVAAGTEAARRRGCDYVDLHGLFLGAIARRGGSDPQLTRDGVHMEPPGDVLMAIGVLRAWGVPDGKMAATDLGEVFG